MQPNHDPIISQTPQILLKLVRPQPEEAAAELGCAVGPVAAFLRAQD